jgi:hypothetical protein
VTEAGLEQVAGGAAPVIDRVTRIGFGTKGMLTIMVGVLALRHALGIGGQLTGQGGAIRALRDQPYGQLSLLAMLAGLSGYAIWMFVAAFMDPERKGTRIAGIAERVAFFITGIGYAALAFGALKLLLGESENGASMDELAASVLTPVLGRWIVGLAGGAVVVAGILQIRLGITAGFRDGLRADLSSLRRAITIMSGRLGYLALGVISLLVGSSLVRVAVEYDPTEAAGWDEALSFLSGLGQGTWVLAAAATGLILYGLYFVLLVWAKEL